MDKLTDNLVSDIGFIKLIPFIADPSNGLPARAASLSPSGAFKAVNYMGQEPGARSQEPGARSYVLGARSQEPGVRSYVLGARSKEQGARSQEPAASSQEPGARSQELCARSQELGDGSRGNFSLEDY